jgi:hypothetical protein
MSAFGGKADIGQPSLILDLCVHALVEASMVLVHHASELRKAMIASASLHNRVVQIRLVDRYGVHRYQTRWVDNWLGYS